MSRWTPPEPFPPFGATCPPRVTTPLSRSWLIETFSVPPDRARYGSSRKPPAISRFGNTLPEVRRPLSPTTQTNWRESSFFNVPAFYSTVVKQIWGRGGSDYKAYVFLAWPGKSRTSDAALLKADVRSLPETRGTAVSVMGRAASVLAKAVGRYREPSAIILHPYCCQIPGRQAVIGFSSAIPSRSFGPASLAQRASE